MPGPISTRLPRRGGNRRLRMIEPSTWWPTLATRQDEAFRHVWQSLRQHGSLEPALSSRAEWRQRGDRFVVCVVPIPQARMFLDTLAPVRNALAGFPFARIAPESHLAIPVQELGYLVDSPKRDDETSMDLIREFTTQAEIPVTDFPSFRVMIGGFNSFRDVPFLDVIDDGWCNRIHHRLRDFVPVAPDDSFPYLPTLPLGHYTRSTALGSFVARMSLWRDGLYGEFHATSMDVIAISTRDPDAAPEILHSFELGHEQGAAQTITRGGPEYR